MTATDKKQQAARDRLGELSTTYETAEKAFNEAREALSAEIVTVLKARTLGPSEVTRLVPFERQHVGRIAKAGGVPPLREATVVSKKQAPARPVERHERPSPDPGTPGWLSDFPAIAVLTFDEARERAKQLELDRPQWFIENRRACTAEPQWVNHAMLAADADDPEQTAS